MAVKYRLQFNNFDLKDVVVTLESADYTGAITDITGVGGESYTKTINGSDSQPYEKHVITTSASIKVFSDLIDVDDLQISNDKEWKITVTVDSVPDFIGFLIPDGIQKTLKGAGNVVHLNATCGLSLLDGMKFDWSKIELLQVGELVHDSGVANNRSPIQYFRALFVQLGNPLTINWSTSIRCDEYPTRDVVAGALPWANGLAIKDLATFDNIDSMWILENLCKSLKLWVAQRYGEWYFINLEDLVRLNGSLSVNRVTGGFGVKTSTTATENFNLDLEGKQINDDAYTYYKNAIGTSRIYYNHSQLQNILPNGGFDYVESSGAITGWSFYGGLSGGFGSATAASSIIERTGNSVELVYSSTVFSDEGIFSLTNPLNIDGNVLYRDMRFGFVMFPQNGFPVDENGYIDWAQFPFKMSVKYTILQGSTLKDYYLNEFGYWSDKNIVPNQEIAQITSVPIPSPTIRIRFNGAKNFFIGDRFNINYRNPSNTAVNYNIVFTENLSDRDGIDYIVSKIPGASRVEVSGVQWLYIPYYNGSSYSASMDKADEYYKYIYPQLQKMKPNIDIGKWEFQSKGNSGGIIIPDPGSLYNKDTNAGKLTIEFYVRSGQKYRIDDVWMELNNNQDVYQLVTDEDNTTEKFEMGISSSFSGFMLSSYMPDYGSANKTMNFTDYSGTSKRLTELYGRGIMNWRYTPRMIYSGSFKHTSITAFSLIEVDGRKFVPLGYEHNVNTGRISNAKLFEAKLESPEIVVGHNNFNDNTNGANYGSGGSYSGGGGGGSSQSLQDTLDIGNVGDKMIITNSMVIPTQPPALFDLQDGSIWRGDGVSPSPLSGQDLESVLTQGNTAYNSGILLGGSGSGYGYKLRNGAEIYSHNSLQRIYLLASDGYYLASFTPATKQMLVVNPDGEVTYEAIPSGGGGGGSVTSVGLTAPTGFSVSNSPITSSGNIALSFATGYSLPSNTKQSQWDNKQDALVSGTNIKTINGTPILGSGNIVVSSSQTLQQTLDNGRTGDSMSITASLVIPTIAPSTIVNGSLWRGTGVTATPIDGTLNGLNDVEVTTPSNGQVLSYNSTTSKWENKTNSGGGGSVKGILQATSAIAIDTDSAGYYIEVNVSSDVNCTLLPALALTSTFIEQSGSGKITAVAGSGVTLRKESSKTGRTKGQYNVIEVFYKTSTEAIIKGDYE